MRRDRASVLSWIFLGAVGLGWAAAHGAPTALAQPAGKRDAPVIGDNKDLARANYDKGRAAEAKGEWEDAYAEYRAAFALVPDPKYEAAFAHAAVELGKNREAAQLIQRLQDSPAAKKALSKAALAALKKDLDAILPKLGKLRVEGPAGAQVWVDGVLFGTLPIKDDQLVDTGERTVEARRDGAVIARAVTTVAAGKTEAIKLVEGEGLAPAPTATAVEPPPPSVTAVTTSAPPATSQVIAPPAATSAPVGGGSPPDSGPSWAGVLTLGGVAVAAAAAGVALWVVADGKGAEARQKYDMLPALPPGPCTSADCLAVHDALKAQEGMQTGAIVAWGVGGAALLGAGAVWLLTGKATPKGDTSGGRPALPRVVPVIAGGTGGLVVQGSW
jgi:hypothetical protein